MKSPSLILSVSGDFEIKEVNYSASGDFEIKMVNLSVSGDFEISEGGFEINGWFWNHVVILKSYGGMKFGSLELKSRCDLKINLSWFEINHLIWS